MWDAMPQVQTAYQHWKILNCKHNPLEYNSTSISQRSRKAKKAAGGLNSREAQHQNPARIDASHSNISSRIDRVLALHSPHLGSQNPPQRNSHSMEQTNCEAVWDVKQKRRH